MKFWYCSISAIFLFVLSFSNLEQLQNGFAISNEHIEQLASSTKHQNWLVNTSDEKQERKKEEKEENNDPEEDNKEEKDSEEEKRENESQKITLPSPFHHISWEISQETLPRLYITPESNNLAVLTLDVPLYVLFECLKVYC